MKPRVSVVVTARDEGGTITAALARITEAVHLPCEILVVCDSPDDTTVPWVEKFAEEDARVRLVINPYGRARRGPSGLGSTAAVADVGGRDDGRRLRRPSADRPADPAGRARRRRGRRLALFTGGPAGGRPVPQGPHVPGGGCSS